MKKQGVIYVMGVSGSGKSTIGRMISRETGFPFFDGDDFHPQANIDKMAAGNPLNDQDRYPWLRRINHFAREKSNGQGAVIACSALKEKYREILSKDIETVQYVHLKGSFDTIMNRLSKRNGHFMPPALLKSQFDTLEIPSYGIEVSIDQNPDLILADLRDKLLL